MTRHTLLALIGLVGVGCALKEEPQVRVPDSVLQDEQRRQMVGDEPPRDQQARTRPAESAAEPDAQPGQPRQTGFERLSSVAPEAELRPVLEQEDGSDFSDSEQVELIAEAMPLGDFITQVFDELLEASYSVDSALSQRMDEEVTLNLREPVSPRELFRLTLKVLSDKGIDVLGREGIYFITPEDSDEASRSLSIGMGRLPSDVPSVEGQVMQLVPLRFGAPRGFQVLLKRLFQVDVNAQDEKQFVFVQGSASNVRRALGLMEILDSPASRAQEVALIDLVHVEPDELIQNMEELMAAEGIELGRGRDSGPLALVALPRRKAVVVFASEPLLLDRVEHWANTIDVPGQTADKRYFLYEPRNARALDMGESLESLLGLARGGGSSAGGGASDGDDGDDGERSSASRSVSGDDLDMVIDERQNQLMFYATPEAYEKIRPMLNRLDRMPKQVGLEVTIAEVTLTEDLQYGVEWFLEKNNYNVGTEGGLGLASSGVNFSAVDSNIGLDVIMNLSRTENVVQVLSRPRVVVTDGMEATVNVGSDIPVLTSTASDVSGGETGSTIVQTVQYRSTGVVLNVTPVVNSRGMVALEISQEVSNTSGDVISGINSPIITQRSFRTSLLVGDGQTAMLGGLISDDTTDGSTEVPWFADIPVLGWFFSSETRSRDKTEIIVMITPRIIENSEDIDDMANRLRRGVERLQ